MLLKFLFLFSLISRAEIIERVVAVVNDELITQSDINKFKEKIKRGKFLDDLVVSNKKDILKDSASLIQHLVNEKIIDSAVKQMGLAITMEKVDQEIETIARRNKISKSDLRSEIKKEGVDFSEYQNFVKQRLERQALLERAVTSKIKITDEEVQAHYLAKNKSGSGESFEYTLAHILISTEKSQPDVAKNKATELSKKLRAGESFEKLAAQYSEDPAFSAGGFLGTFKSGEFLKELEAGIRGLNVGAISEPIKSRNGYHLVKVLNKKIISDPVFERQKEELRNLLYQDAFKNQFAFWLEQQRSLAFIKINR